MGERAVRTRRAPLGAQAYLNSTLSTASKRNEVLAVVWRASTGRVVRNAVYSHPRPGQQVFTRHETRDTNHGLFGTSWY